MHSNNDIDTNSYRTRLYRGGSGSALLFGIAGPVLALLMVGACNSSNGSSGSSGSSGDAGSGGEAGSGSDGSSSMVVDHCTNGYGVDSRDAKLTGEPVKYTVASSGEVDLILPDEVKKWMTEHSWQQAHNDWHDIRRWDQLCPNNPSGTGCKFAEGLIARGLWRAPIQQYDKGGGLEFLVMHRHMIQGLRKAFPQHAKLFSSFTHFPKTVDDPENPMPWKGDSYSWSASILDSADRMENIEKNLDQFATEDDLGRFIMCGSCSSSMGQFEDSLHLALHAQWAISGSPSSLGSQAVNIENYVFWKLHGWIDDIWERYRVAKGLTADDPTLKTELFDQCKEMHKLARTPTDDTDLSQPLPAESGYFHEKIRQAFLDKKCGSCHSETSPEAGMSLGGHITSANILLGLVGVKATNGEYDLVVAGDPDHSWLYLKASGKATSATCTGQCNKQSMPPGATGLDTDQLAILRQWILDGATYDTVSSGSE